MAWYDAVASGIGSLLGIGGQKSANDTNLKIARETNAQNMAMFRENLAYNSPAQQKERLQQAGLNSDLMYQNGASGLVNTQVPQMQQSAPMQNTMGNLGDLGLITAQIRNLDAQTDAQDIENKRKRAEDEFFQNSNNRIYDPETGETIDDVDEWKKNNPGREPGLEILPKFKNKGSFDAFMHKLEMYPKRAESQQRVVSANLLKSLKKAQWLDPDIRNALVNQPKQDFEKGAKEIALWASQIALNNQNKATSKAEEDLLITQKDLMDLQKRLDENAPTWGAFTAMLKDPKAGLGDKILSFLGFAISQIGGMSSFSFAPGRKSGGGLNITQNNNR